jgi:hypothetical protein
LLRSKDVLWYFNHYWISKIPEKLRFDGLGITVIVDDYPIMLYVHKKSIYFSYNIFVSAIIPSFSFFSEEILPNKLNENTKIAIKKNRLVVDGKETSISIDFTNPGLTLSANERNLSATQIYDLILSLLEILNDTKAKPLVR